MTDRTSHEDHAKATERASVYRTEFTTEPGEVRAGETATLRFLVRDEHGGAVKDLQIVHEKAMHLLVISGDLDEFEHLHLEQQPDGAYQTIHTFPHGGDYLLYADYTPPDGIQRVDRHALFAAGGQRERVALAADAEQSKMVDGLRFKMQAEGELRAGRGVMLNFIVTDAERDEPVTDLQPYLGAMAHFVVISEDTTDFLHVHPMEKEAHGSGEPGGHEHHGTAHQAHEGENSEARSNEVAAHTVFPHAGLYKLWAQFQRGGRVITVPFVLRVA